MEKRIHFIVGTGRSGTTLLKEIINADPNYLATPELKFVLNFLLIDTENEILISIIVFSSPKYIFCIIEILKLKNIYFLSFSSQYHSEMEIQSKNNIFIFIGLI